VLLLLATGGVAQAQPGEVPRAVDGRSLRDESIETQARFSAVWGDEAATHWVTEHNAELARLQPAPASVPTTGPTATRTTAVTSGTPATSVTPTSVLPTSVTTTPGGATATQATTSGVEMRGFAFNPASITVRVGTTVTWTNADSVAHTATGPSFDTGPIPPGGAGRATFTSPGQVSYACTIHPQMRGTIVVQ